MDTQRQLPIEIRNHILRGQFRITEHAFEEMLDETISLDDFPDALLSCKIVEEYPDHRRGLVADQTTLWVARRDPSLRSG